MDRQRYAELLKFEHDLINRRITWLLSSQSLLFAAYALALQATEKSSDSWKAAVGWFLKTVAATGVCVASFVLIGIVASAIAKYCVWQDFRKVNPEEQWWVRTWLTVMGLIPDFLVPIAFAIVWTLVFGRTP